jgi:hypothetical protein
MMDTGLDIPPSEPSDTESGNGRACIELSIEPGSSYIVEHEDSEPDWSRSLPLDEQIVGPPPLGPWIEDQPLTPGLINSDVVDADTQCVPEPLDVKPQIEYGDQSSQTDPGKLVDVERTRRGPRADAKPKRQSRPSVSQPPQAKIPEQKSVSHPQLVQEAPPPVALEEPEPLAIDKMEFDEDLRAYSYQHSDVFSLQPSSTPATVTSGTETDNVALIDIAASPIGNPSPSRGEPEPIP